MNLSTLAVKGNEIMEGRRKKGEKIVCPSWAGVLEKKRAGAMSLSKGRERGEGGGKKAIKVWISEGGGGEKANRE